MYVVGRTCVGTVRAEQHGAQVARREARAVADRGDKLAGALLGVCELKRGGGGRRVATLLHSR